MIGTLKEQAAKFIINRKPGGQLFNEREFSSIFKHSFSFLILMPVVEKDFRLAMQLLEFLKESKKNVITMTNDFRISLLPPSLKNSAIEHGINEKNKLDLPSRKILQKLDKMRFDVVIDMNRSEVLYYSFVTKHLKSPIKIGFVRPNSDKYFNLQIVNNSTDAEIAYQNLLNCLKMF